MLPLAIGFPRREGPAIEVPVEVNWLPAVESARFGAIRRGASPETALEAQYAVDPVWDRVNGPPRLAGAQVRLAGALVEPLEVPLEYLADQAVAAAAELVKDGRLPGDEQPFRWFATARDAPESGNGRPRPARRLGFLSRWRAPPLPIETGWLDESLNGSRPAGDPREGDFPVVIHRSVLREAAALTLERRGRETGGVLVGRLRRDPLVPEVFAEITGQIPATDAKGDAVRLSFTRDVWSAMRAAVMRLGGGQLMLGWWHSHPVLEWCKDCDEEHRRACSLGEGFLSADDRQLHRTVFPRAWSVALLLSDTGADQPRAALFGWRAGGIERRGFHVREEESNHAG